ncbi:MAG: Asp-tRNA(Asn)/Glu-tRNA(Gln) amidotransferase subunit GatA [Thalassobaculum sp.]|uniref:Asp-tRNA(Asn)/Glu-tRNA(Gln) amidotransferase subunit GatA n=1 Tax=Thalassobaculum sp. TaxID=2022740 RepID=UPI0032F01AAF
MAGILDLDLVGARDALRAGDITSSELTAAYLARIEATKDLNAYITVTADRAMAMAEASDARLAKGEGGALEGLPIAVKDLFCTEGVLTTAASHILDGFKPTYESTVTAKLWDAGAVMLGKTNMDEFAMGSSNGSSYYGPAVNPWRAAQDAGTRLVPGGSSGGSAAAVSGRAALAATGTDTGGSIRQPASYTGIVGVKPSYGRCSRWGIVAFASSLDQAGPMARTVGDAAVMLSAMAGHDPRDSTSAPEAMPDLTAGLEQGVKGLRIGIPAEYKVDGMPSEIEAIWAQGIAWLRDAGAEIVDISLPHTRYALATYYILAPAEASSNLARYDGVRYGLRVDGDSLAEMYANTRGAGFGAEVQRRILIGTYVLSAGYYDAYYRKAQRVRTLIRRDFDEAFGQVDAILAPTAPSDAFAVGANEDDPVKMYLNDVFTVPASLAGLPGASVPAGLSARGLPLGLQVLGRMFDEPMVLRVARALEKAAAFTARPAMLEGV